MYFTTARFSFTAHVQQYVCKEWSNSCFFRCKLLSYRPDRGVQLRNSHSWRAVRSGRTEIPGKFFNRALRRLWSVVEGANDSDGHTASIRMAVSPFGRIPSQQTGGIARPWHALVQDASESCWNSWHTADWPKMSSSSHSLTSAFLADRSGLGAQGCRPCCYWCWLLPSQSAGGNRLKIRHVSVWIGP